MTPIILLDNLAEFIREKTKDIKLQVRTRSESAEDKVREAEIYKMRLPNKDAQTQRVPYILIQLLGGEDNKEEREPEESTCQIRIVVAAYAEDAGAGSTDVLNLILQIRSELKKAGILGKTFCLQLPLEYIIYPDSPQPYYFGEMITNWSLPIVKREVESIWQ